MLEETRFKCRYLNTRSKMRFSQRLKLCVNTIHIFSHLIMPPTLKKLMGHIAFGACVGAWVGGCVRGWVTLFVSTVTFKPLKLES